MDVVMPDDSDIQDVIEDSLSNSESSESDALEISSEENSVRVELLAYNGDFDAKSIQSDLELGRREALFFSIENRSGQAIDIYCDEWQLIGQDDFIYDYVEEPYREIYETEYPPHYPTTDMIHLSPGTKTRYVLISAVLPDSITIRRIEHNFSFGTSFSLELPENLPEQWGQPPL